MQLLINLHTQLTFFRKKIKSSLTSHREKSDDGISVDDITAHASAKNGSTDYDIVKPTSAPGALIYDGSADGAVSANDGMAKPEGVPPLLMT